MLYLTSVKSGLILRFIVTSEPSLLYGSEVVKISLAF